MTHTVSLCLAVASGIAWLAAEIIDSNAKLKLSTHIATATLAFSIFFAGITVWKCNQNYGERGHLMRFAVGGGELPVSVRARVIVAPGDAGGQHASLYWTAEATEILAEQGWIPAAGLAQVKWRGNASSPALHRGDAIELYGWMQRPPRAVNPGGLDLRQRLAADRIFTEIRVPRANGIVRLAEAGLAAPHWLTGLRLMLRGKLLEHTTRVDVDAANTMVALVLGYRDPSMEDISRAFADAGVAHLLAISGSHIVFFAGVVWVLLRLVPMRPRWREPLATGIVFAYVLATPCGPPVMRAAVGVGMVLISRMLGRPRAYMNMLAAAAMVIVLMRPTDCLDAGFQLTFVCTAGLLLLAARLRAALFDPYLKRQELLANLAATRSSRLRLRALKMICVLVTANMIGTVTAAPLVMFHFNQINFYGIVTGLIAFPLVAFTMVVSLMQLALEWVSASAATVFAPVSTAVARATIWLIEHLAALPGAAVGVRSPSAWLAALMFMPIIVWAMRRWLGLGRAAIVNIGVGALATVIAWYAVTAPVGGMRLQLLSVGQGSSIVLTTPRGETWMLNAGSRDLPNAMVSAIAPTLRKAGVRQLDGLLLTSLDAVHASVSADVIERYHPRVAIIPSQQNANGWTLAADKLETAATASHLPLESLRDGDHLHWGDGSARVLWPPTNGSAASPTVVMLEFANRRVLLLDAASIQALSILPLNHVDLHCDVVVLLSPERGRADEPLRRLLADTTAETLIWCGRTAWAPTWSSPTISTPPTEASRSKLQKTPPSASPPSIRKPQTVPDRIAPHPKPPNPLSSSH